VAFGLAIVMALAFAVTNGFHDAANAIAALVATRAARPIPAVIFASVFNMLGPFVVGAAVADTVAAIVQLPAGQMIPVVGAGLTGAVVWNTITWMRGLPASSSHALIGGLVGAALLEAGPTAVSWDTVVVVVVALAVSPLVGFAASLATEALGRRSLRRATTRVDRPIRAAQWAASGWLAFSHGSNDAQKAVGIIAALLVAHGDLATLSTPPWAIAAASFALTIGTALGGWSIIRTIGSRIIRLRPLDGLASQVSSAGVILVASLVGAPVSTTQVVSSSVVGTGVGRGRRRRIRWQVVREIAVAWITTPPAAALLAAATLPFWRWLA
jgi:PiT family inorganic phosphate transporter